MKINFFLIDKMISFIKPIKTYPFLLIITTCVWFVFSCSLFPPEGIYIEPFNWEISSPEKQGLNSSELGIAVDELQELEDIHSILVIRNGYLLLEEYFNDYNAYQGFEIRSITKSFLSALIGIAIDKGFIKNLDVKLLDFFPEYVTNDIDERKYDITLRHLLLMQAGFPGDKSSYYDNIDSYNLVESFLKVPLVQEPGEQVIYSTAAAHLVSAILSKSTGLNAWEFAKEFLHPQLGIDLINWDMDFQQNSIGGTGITCTSRDLARFGYLYMEEGFIDGTQIMPKEWIEMTFSDELIKNRSWGPISKLGIQYYWWSGKFGSYSFMMASGYGGQFIIYFPEQELLIVTTGDPYNYNQNHDVKILRAINDHILGSILE